MSPELVVTLFVLVALTVPAAIGGVFVFRGTYYKSLPGRIEHLEAENMRLNEKVEKQDSELNYWKGIATQTPEIRKLLEFYERHDANASDRFSSIDRHHKDILDKLSRIEVYLNERDRRGGNPAERYTE